MRRGGLVLLVAALLAGCGGDGDAPDAEPGEDIADERSPCERAVEVAAEVDEMQDTQEDLWPAFDACNSLDEFAAASEAYPDALDGADPETYVRNGCQYEPEVANSPLCTALDE